VIKKCSYWKSFRNRKNDSTKIHNFDENFN
jgi:hypothetical protein